MLDINDELAAVRRDHRDDGEENAAYANDESWLIKLQFRNTTVRFIITGLGDHHHKMASHRIGQTKHDTGLGERERNREIVAPDERLEHVGKVGCVLPEPHSASTVSRFLWRIALNAPFFGTFSTRRSSSSK